MRLVTRWTRAAEAAQKLRDHAEELRSTPFAALRCVKEAQAVEALGPRPHPDAVDAIVGDDDYTHVGWCRECVLVAFDEDGNLIEEIADSLPRPEAMVEFDSGDDAVRLCAKCLLKAMTLIEP